MRDLNGSQDKNDNDEPVQDKGEGTQRPTIDVKVETTPIESWHAIAYDEYKNTLFTLRNRQLEIVKTYLWIGSALLTFELFFANELAAGDKIRLIRSTPDALYYLAESMAIAASSASFFVSIWLLKGRNSEGTIYPFGFGEGKDAVTYLHATDTKEYISENIHSLHTAICAERKNLAFVGKKLRLTCFLLLFSFAFQACAILWMIARTVYYNHFA